MKRVAVRVSIDPGSTGTGIALWREEEWDALVPPIEVRNFMPAPINEHWREKTFGIVARMQKDLAKYDVRHAYFEQPEFFDTAGGHMAAKTGDLIKLTFFFGACAYAVEQLGIPMTFYPVHEWKGQLPKNIVTRRIIGRIPTVNRLKPQSHSWDAIGIGLHAKGFKFVR
jgi:hypothetical protein